MTNSSAQQTSHPFDLTSRIVETGVEIARKDAPRAAAMMAAAGISFRVIVRVVS